MIYEIDTSGCEAELDDLVEINISTLKNILQKCEEYNSYIRNPSDERFDERVSRRRFHALLALALQHGVEAGHLADYLQVSISTIHRWAKGTFVPPHLFVREAAINGVIRIIYQIIHQTSKENAKIPEKYYPPTRRGNRIHKPLP